MTEAPAIEGTMTHARSCAHCGEPSAYAAPEFFRGQTSDQSDQYALAVTYCQLRGGRLPFEGNQEQVMAGHLMHPPDLTMLPEAERPVVARALAKKPAERWPNCRAFVEALAVGIEDRTPVVPDGSRQTLPGLGLEGELAAAWGAARLISLVEKKRDPLKRDVLLSG